MENMKTPAGEQTNAVNPYANGKGRAIVERLFRESKEAKEHAIREHSQNPKIRAFYAELRQKQKEQDTQQ